MTAIIKKELKSYFTNMSGYLFLFFFVLMTAVFFFNNNIRIASGDYYLVIISTTLLFLVMIPMLTMRLFPEEYSQKTDQLLYTAPISIGSIVLGKFMAAVLVLLLAIGITVIFPFMISPYGALPISRIAGTYIGFLLLGMCFISIGVFISVLTNNQIIAAVGTFAAVFAFYISDGFISSLPADRVTSIGVTVLFAAVLGYILYDRTKSIRFAVIFSGVLLSITAAVYFINPNLFDGLIIKGLRFISLMSHFGSFSMGVVNFSDIVYYLTFAACFNYFAINTIEKRRWV